MRQHPVKAKRFKSHTDPQDPRTGKEKAEAFKIQQLAGGFTVKTIEYHPVHDVEIEVY